MKLQTKENIYGYIFISPWLIGFILLSIGPMIMSIVFSFTDYDYFKPLNFIGLENYRQIIFHDDLFHKSLTVTLRYVMSYAPLRVGLALLVAVLLNQEIRGMSFYRTIYYMPSILGQWCRSVGHVASTPIPGWCHQCCALHFRHRRTKLAC